MKKQRLPGKYKLNLSKKTKREILEYLRYRRDLTFEKCCEFNMYEHAKNYLILINDLMLDIEFFGVK